MIEESTQRALLEFYKRSCSKPTNSVLKATIEPITTKPSSRDKVVDTLNTVLNSPTPSPSSLNIPTPNKLQLRILQLFERDTSNNHSCTAQQLFDWQVGEDRIPLASIELDLIAMVKESWVYYTFDEQHFAKL